MEYGTSPPLWCLAAATLHYASFYVLVTLEIYECILRPLTTLFSGFATMDWQKFAQEPPLGRLAGEGDGEQAVSAALLEESSGLRLRKAIRSFEHDG